MRHRTILPVLVTLLFSLVPMQASAEAPTLLLDGIPDHKVVDIGVDVTVSFSENAQVYKYDDSMCSINPQNRGTVAFDQGSAFAATNWYQANTIGVPEEKSPCLSITWQEPVGPSLTLDSGLSDLLVESDEAVTVATEAGATIYRYNDAACTVGGFVALPSTSNSEAYTGPATYYYKASWNDPARTGTSICLGVSWKEAPPRIPPTIWLDGGSTHVTVHSFTDVEVTTEPGAIILYYASSTCGVVPSVIEDTRYSVGGSFEGPFTHSFQAAWSDDRTVKSDCLHANWLLAGPQLYLDDTATHRTVNVGSPIHFRTESGAQVVTYASLDCTGPETGRYDLETTDTQATPTAYSASAFWAGESTGARSCYVATWEERPEPISLTLNGVAGDVQVWVGESVKYESAAGATILTFPNERCNPPERSSEPGPVIETLTSPGLVSVIAVSGGLYSPCYTATWIDPSTPDDGTATSTIEATQTPTPSPEATSTSTVEAEQKQTTIRIEMWDGSSIEGATWSLYAPVASQFHTVPYLTGALDAKNRTVFTDLPTGQYRFVLEPPGMDQQVYLIAVSDASEEIVLQVRQPSSEPIDVTVTGLPSTGSGMGAGSFVMGLASLMAAGIAITAIGSRRLKP